MKWVLILHVMATWTSAGYERRVNFGTMEECWEASHSIRIEGAAYEVSCLPLIGEGKRDEQH